MEPRLLQYYNRELQHLREVGGEFSRQFPKIAGRLGLEGFECADPYVERLLEGFAFLAARVQLRIDAEFPRFTQHLLETVYPGYAAPLPSMALVQFEPDSSEGSLAAGVKIPRQSALRGQLGKGDQTPCEYRTAHEVELWPLEIAEAEYFRFGAASSIDVPAIADVKSGLRLRLRVTGGLRFDQLALDRLSIHLRGAEDLPMRLYEQLLGDAAAVVVRPVRRPAPWHEVLDARALRRVGFEEHEALLPVGLRHFSGYRLVHEYFTFPARFMFVELAGLQRAARRSADAELDVIVLFRRFVPALENAVDRNDFALFCTPAINLFPKKADRIHLSEREHEYHVVPDRTRPMDFEVVQVVEVEGLGAGGESAVRFLPFYACADPERYGEHQAFFTVRRSPRLLSERQRAQGGRSSYYGSEAFVALVDGHEAPYASDLRQLAVTTWCTNRDLPLHLPLGAGRTDFTMIAGAPVKSVRCLAGPTTPRAAPGEGDIPWRLISHLAPNYLSLTDTDERQGAAALREILALYGDLGDPVVRKQVEGVRSVSCQPVLRRVGRGLHASFARGLQVGLTLDEAAFQGSGVFLLGSVLEEFFARYVSINSFTETVLRTVDRGEVMRWPPRIGRRPIA